MNKTDREMVIKLYKNMYFYYLENVGKRSEITGMLITPRRISRVLERILELGGDIPTEPYEVCWEEITKV